MKWEHKTIKLEAKGFMSEKLDLTDFDSFLNDLGNDEWELVSGFDTNLVYGQTRDVVAIFKRPIN